MKTYDDYMEAFKQNALEVKGEIVEWIYNWFKENGDGRTAVIGLSGGKDSAVILDHYAEVLYALKEYDLAFVYWNLALQKEDDQLPGLKEKVESRRKEAGK